MFKQIAETLGYQVFLKDGGIRFLFDELSHHRE